MAASGFEATTHSQSTPRDYIKLLASYFKTLPGPQSSALRPSGVMIRSKEPNLPSTRFPHPSGRPRAEHLIKSLALHTAAPKINTKAEVFKPRSEKIIHPGKALTLRAVKTIHLSTPHIYKVKA